MTNATNASTRGDASLDSLVAGVVDEFRERQKRGETPDVEEYAARHPEAADLLRKVLATFQLLDGSSFSSASDGVREATDDAPLSGTLGDFRLLREVGRGGMGVVYEAEQISLGRRVALKVLPFAATLHPRQLQRFHNEARAAASLHHEHIVPVFAVGQERGIHFFAMQFIEGHTLADIVKQHKRGSAASASDAPTTAPGESFAKPADTEPIAGKSTEPVPHDTAYFQRVAEWGIQAALALEHAHTLGIVHRDIKPGNLMIDAHGQLWIADFGLARRAADSDLTMSGDLLGTLRYMSPEQALAKHDLVDHRSDVYSLGATLYELLTLHSAVGGKDRHEIIQQITQTDAQSLRRWDSRIPADLETIVLKALAKEPDGRYATAKELAEDLRRYLSHEPIRARRPTLRQNFAKWTKRNRAAVLAASIAALVTVAVLSAAAGIEYQREQDRLTREHDRFLARQDRVITDAMRLLDEAENQLKEIDAKLGDSIKVCELLSNIDGWKDDLAKARAAWKHSTDLAGSNQDVVVPELGERLRLMDEQLTSQEKDWKIAKKLDDIRLDAAMPVDGRWNPKAVGSKYEKALTDLGLDWTTNQPSQIASKIRQTRLRFVLVVAVDDWAHRTADHRVTAASLLETAQLADPNPWRDKLRDMKNWADSEVLAKLAQDVDVSRQSPQTLFVLASRIKKSDQPAFLRAALIQYPRDFWLHFLFGNSLQNPDEIIGHYHAALAIRPTNAPARYNVGYALREKKDFDGAIREFRKAIELAPNFVNAYINLASVLRTNKDLEGAIFAYRKAIELDPDRPDAHNELGVTLRANGDVNGAIEEFQKTIKLDPNRALAYDNLGLALRQKMDLKGAIREHRKAIMLDPNLANAHNNLGVVLLASKDIDGAIQEFRNAIELDPNHANAHNNLGSALRDKKDIDGAIREFRKAIELDPKAATHENLGIALHDKKDIDGTIREFRKAIELDPKIATTHYYLGNTLLAKKNVDGAMQHYREAIALDPTYAEAHCNLGHCLGRIGQFGEALKQLRRGHELGSNKRGWPYPSAQWVQSMERIATCDQNMPAVLKDEIRPNSFTEWLGYIEAATLKKTYSNANRLCRQLLVAHKNLDDPETAVDLLSGLAVLQSNPVFSPLRDAKKLAALPEDDQNPWQDLWADVAKAQKEARAKFREIARNSNIIDATKRERMHEIKLQAGKTYVLDLGSTTFDTFLQLFDDQGKKLAENDDIEPGVILNSRLIFHPKADGSYRIVASAFQNSGTGPYTLTIREFIK